MREIRTEIQIKATANRVWDVLTDFKRYPEWNPFIKYLKGKPMEGTKIEVKMASAGSKGMILKPKVLKFQRCKEFRWLGHIVIPGLFDGEHIFEIINIPNNATLFIQREKFYGILVPLLKNTLDKSTKAGFEAMNKQLKHICEMK
ncbi:SRPBCC domain-containing protein [Sporolactobacillus pectinivorans]|uniref:SRPBCC domain-containing protein n=1 Tax=Sporolactobacillus pectinivorans TaxID=1591408 RepID=UPI000C260F2E|nr:SRPBCC domain-containing protein [Sporolactobacillus pectinivorans]